MAYKLHQSKVTITRPANTTSYAAFRLLSGADNVTFACPIRSSKESIVYLESMVCQFNWALTPSSNSVRIYLFSENPGSVVDNSANTSFDATTIYDSYIGKFFFNTVNDGAGMQSTQLNILPPIPLTSSVPALYAIMELGTGITTPTSAGQVKLVTYFEESF